jgi:sec-independent protein translocase protein TatA
MINSPIALAVVAGIALIIFGPKKLPELGRALGQGIGNFKKSLQEAQEEVKGAINSETSEPKEPKQIADTSSTAHSGSCCGGAAHTHAKTEETQAT